MTKKSKKFTTTIPHSAECVSGWTAAHQESFPLRIQSDTRVPTWIDDEGPSDEWLPTLNNKETDTVRLAESGPPSVSEPPYPLETVNNVCGCGLERKYKMIFNDSLNNVCPIPQACLIEMDYNDRMNNSHDVIIEGSLEMRAFRMIQRSSEVRSSDAHQLEGFEDNKNDQPEYYWTQLAMRLGHAESEPKAGKGPVENECSILFGFKNSTYFCDDWEGVHRARMYHDDKYWTERIKSVKSHSAGVKGAWRRGQYDVIKLDQPIELKQYWTISVFIKIPPMFDNHQPRPICGTDHNHVHLMFDRRGAVGCIIDGKQKFASTTIWDDSRPERGKHQIEDENHNLIPDPRFHTEPVWVHLAVVAEGETQEYFVNGIHLGFTPRVVRTPIIAIGNMDDDQSSKPCGPIYDFTVWDCSLTTAELKILSSTVDKMNSLKIKKSPKKEK